MNVDAAKARKGGASQQALRPTSEEYKPPSDWTHDDVAHVLLLELTGFKKDDLKLQVDNLRNITVSGERSVGENRSIWFKQIFQIPHDSDASRISGKFDNGLLFVIMPKKEAENKDEDQEIAGKDGTKEGMTKKEAEKKVSQKDGTKERVPTEKKGEVGRGESMKEGLPTSKQQEKVQKEKTEEEGKLTTKEQDKTKEEGMLKGREQQEVQDDATALGGSPTKEEEQPMEEKEEEVPDQSKVVPGTKQNREPEKDVGGVEGTKDGKKESSDDEKEDSKIGGCIKEVMKKSEELNKMKDLGEKLYKKGRKVLGDEFCDKAMEKIKNNRAIIATAIVAFSLGFYLSSKLKRTE